jgi:antitoxin ParD1/3/4
MERIDVPLDDGLRAHIELRTSGDDYPDAGTYIRALIEDDRQRLEELRAAIDEGVQSGIDERSIDEIVAAARARLRG